MSEVRTFRLTGGLYNSQVRPTMTLGTHINIPQTHGVLELWYEDNKMLVLKEKGHREYYNQYNSPFKVPTQFHVFLKVNQMDPEPQELMEVGVFPLNRQEV